MHACDVFCRLGVTFQSSACRHVQSFKLHFNHGITPPKSAWHRFVYHGDTALSKIVRFFFLKYLVEGSGGVHELDEHTLAR